MKDLFNALLVLAVLSGIGLGTYKFLKEEKGIDPVSTFSKASNEKKTADARKSNEKKPEDTESTSSESSTTTSQQEQETSSEQRDHEEQTRKLTKQPSDDASERDTSEETASSSDQNENPSSETDERSDRKQLASRSSDFSETDSTTEDTGKKTAKVDQRRESSKKRSSRKKFSKAKKLINVAKYEEALETLNELSAADVNSDEKTTLNKLRTKARELKKVMEETDISPERASPTRVKIEMTGGGQPMEGLLLEETDNGLRVRQNSTVFTLRDEEIRSVEKYSQEETRKYYRNEIKKKFEKFGPLETYVIDQYYDRAKQEFHNFLWSDGARTLNYAYEKEGDQLYEAIRNMRAMTYYNNYKFYKERGYDTLAKEQKEKLTERYPDHKFTKKLTGKRVASSSSSNDQQQAQQNGGTTGGTNQTENASGAEEWGSSSSSSSSSSSTPTSQPKADSYNIRLSEYSSGVRSRLKKAKNLFEEAMEHYNRASNDDLSIQKRKSENAQARDMLQQAMSHIHEAKKKLSGSDQDVEGFLRHTQDLFGKCYRRQKMWGVY